jgi:ABC-type branched-subunit amino acid transport system permease subunit
VIAAIVGFPLMKMSGFQASIGTLALLIIINVVIANWKDVTTAPARSSACLRLRRSGTR